MTDAAEKLISLLRFLGAPEVAIVLRGNNITTQWAPTIAGAQPVDFSGKSQRDFLAVAFFLAVPFFGFAAFFEEQPQVLHIGISSSVKAPSTMYNQNCTTLQAAMHAAICCFVDTDRPGPPMLSAPANSRLPIVRLVLPAKGGPIAAP